ncbi:MAG TPA: hypothetical protein VFO34_10200 [Candidatus Acidoferrales bacterium]|nr:hypothetical protein [Candidatus Acidoferrales bacterium]
MRRIFMAVALGAFLSAAAGAQTDKKMVQPQTTITRVPVTDAPYCGQEIFEHTQKLSDGTNIDRKLTTSVCRDAQGRERRENDSTITITDPVEGASYHIDKASHTATRSPMGVLKIAVDKTPAGSATLNIVTGNVTVIPLNDGGARGMVDGATAAASGSPGARGGRGSSMDQDVESLGVKMMEGLMVEGSRTTRVIPSGQIGNDRPIESVYENWYSKDLHVTVLRRVTDPMNGNTLNQLTDIQRSTPNPALFSVPPGYAVRDLTQK